MIMNHKVLSASEPALLILILIIFVLGYLSYLYALRLPFLNKVLRAETEREKRSLRRVLMQRTAGLVLLGIFPGAVCYSVLGLRFSNYGMALKFESSDLIWMLGAGAGASILSFLVSALTDNTGTYPQIRIKSWGKLLVLINALSWLAYLLAYEFLFRGIVLFASFKTIGFWPAIVLNVVLYSLAHWPKGIREVLGAIPLGIVLCLITLETGMIWAALAAHIVLAVTNDHFSLRSNPEMRYSFRK